MHSLSKRSAAEVSGSRANVPSKLTFRTTRKRALSPHLTNSIDPPNGLEEPLTQAENSLSYTICKRTLSSHLIDTANPPNSLQEPSTQEDTALSHSIDIADSTNKIEERSSRECRTRLTNSRKSSLATFSRAGSIASTPAEANINLSREELLDILAMFIGALPCIWHLLRAFAAAYISVLSSTPRLAAPAFAVFSFPFLWVTARGTPLPQKIRLMSYIANLGNWLILTVEFPMWYSSAWLSLMNISPAWETGIVASELQWILMLLVAWLVFVIFLAADICFLVFVLDEELDGSIGSFKDRLFSDSNE